MADPAVVERLLAEADAAPDPAVRELATALAGALVELYGEGLERIVAAVAEHDRDGAMAAALGADDLVAHLLLLHGLHPEPVELRVERALEEVRPYLTSHGGAVALLDVADGVARVRLEGSCDGCPSSAATLELAIRDAVARAAPDVDRVEAERPDDERAPMAPLHVLPPDERHARDWTTIAQLPEACDGERRIDHVGAEEVLFVHVGGRWVAYRPACPACGGSLRDADLDGTALTCPACGQGFDARRAGRGLGGSELHLDPVPLLPAGDGRLKVAAAV
jgi:Fe-S cluster biogenesis protein NfuA/nitrite reductase/ring-hydroxylating ferredoxin subunit